MATNESGLRDRAVATLGSWPYLSCAAVAAVCAVLSLPSLQGSGWWLLGMLSLPAGAGYLWPRTRRPVPGTPPPAATEKSVPPAAVRARTFFFLDNRLTAERLGQYENGVPSTYTERRTELVRKGLVAGMHLGMLQADGSAGTEATREIIHVKSPAPGPTFNLLHAYLRDDPDNQLRNLDADAADGAPPAAEQFCELLVDCKDVFQPELRRTVQINRQAMFLTLELGPDSVTDDTRDARGTVTAMGRVTHSSNLPGGRTDITLRVYAIYR